MSSLLISCINVSIHIKIKCEIASPELQRYVKIDGVESSPWTLASSPGDVPRVGQPRVGLQLARAVPAAVHGAAGRRRHPRQLRAAGRGQRRARAAARALPEGALAGNFPK